MTETVYAARRKSAAVVIEHADCRVRMGAGAPVVVQSMTNTATEDICASVKQVAALALAGSELVRLTVNTPEAARAVPRIREALDEKGIYVPLVGDFHYNGHKLLADYPECAQALSKYRINPGNVGKGIRHEDNFAVMVETAVRNNKAVRIGVNGGSLDKELLSAMMDANRALNKPRDVHDVWIDAIVESAAQSAERAQQLGLPAEKIVLSAKVSDVSDLIAVNRKLAARGPWALHLGLTEAGIGTKGIVASSAALAVLLAEGIGDTIRISITPAPGKAREEEVIVAQELLQSMGLRNFSPLVVSCPGCGRTSSDLFQHLAQRTQQFLRARMPEWRTTAPGAAGMRVAVMGCVVNGPGESASADIGISLPGRGESPVAPVYADGVKIAALKGETMAEDFEQLIEQYVMRRYACGCCRQTDSGQKKQFGDANIMAKIKITGVKGMNDMLPADAPIWEKFEDAARQTAASYGYRQIRTPILEATQLFSRGIGEVTDIVEKEMYSFTDSMNGEQLTLRPENTSAVVRSVIEHNLTYGAPQRLWYFGPMFRHERPQRGRYRQFYQFGCEALGFAGPDIDIEMLAMLSRLWKRLGIEARLELNSLGALEERARHRQALIEYFEANQDVLDEDAKRRLYTNPLRILDTKNPAMQDLVNAAPKLLDYLGEESRAFLGKLEAGVQALGISYSINPRLVRGLDYYNHTVFEWITERLGSQGTICGGGRYDPLVEMLGGRPTPAVGFAMGAERVIELMRETAGEVVVCDCDIYIAHQGGHTELVARTIGEKLRDAGLRVIVHAGSTSFKSMMRRADQSLARWAVIAGESEVDEGMVSVKQLRDAAGSQVFADQMRVEIDALGEMFGRRAED